MKDYWRMVRTDLSVCWKLVLPVWNVEHLLFWLITGRNEVVAKVMFLLVSVILSTGGLPQCMLGYHHTPPGGRHPPDTTPQEGSTPPGKEAPPGIRSMSGRYASYWNTFLFFRFFSKLLRKSLHIHDDTLLLEIVACITHVQERNVILKSVENRFKYKDSWCSLGTQNYGDAIFKVYYFQNISNGFELNIVFFYFKYLGYYLFFLKCLFNQWTIWDNSRFIKMNTWNMFLW